MNTKSPRKQVQTNTKRSESVWAKEVFSNGQQSLQSIIGSSPIPAFTAGLGSSDREQGFISGKLPWVKIHAAACFCDSVLK